MKECVLYTAPNLPACKYLLQDKLFNNFVSNFNNIIKVVIVNDERTRKVLINANEFKLPFLKIDTGEGIVSVRGVNFIIKWINDLYKTLNIENVEPDVEPSKVGMHEIMKRTVKYVEVMENIFSIDELDDLKSIPDKYDLIYLDEGSNILNKRKLSQKDISTNNKHVNVGKDSLDRVVTSLLSHIDIKESPPMILIVSKNEKFVESIVALYMFHVNHNHISEIQDNLNTIIKKPLLDLMIVEYRNK
jgi:hypothetical protein